MIRLYDPDEHWLAKCAMHTLLAPDRRALLADGPHVGAECVDIKHHKQILIPLSGPKA